MPDNEGVAYYEDLEPPSSQQSTKSTETTASVKTATPNASQDAKKGVSVKTAATKAEPTTSTKRQRTLDTMFGGTAKKAKLERAGASSSSASAPAVTPSKPKAPGTTLNSIPFSMSEFEESLSDDEKELLALECKTLGKSWYAVGLPSFRCDAWNDEHVTFRRLKILKDEIR
jgi:uracil-DNA glycosylase